MRSIVCFAGLLLLGAIMAAQGAEIVVPRDYQSIQRALDAAKPGDTVHLAAGTYSESVTLPGGVALEGEGPETTTLQLSAERGTVVTIKDVTDVTVSEITFQHSSPETDWPRKYNDVVDVSGASARFVHCVFQKGGGCGLIATKKSTVSAERCVALDNVQAGLAVMDTGSTAVFTENECHRNQRGGIYVLMGASATVEKNQCNENSEAGIQISESSKSIVRENRCEGNVQDGIIVGQSTDTVVEDNQCRNNQRGGILVTWGAEAVLSGNTCEENANCGILARCPGAVAEMSGNTVRANRHHGVQFAYGAKGTAKGNTISGNRYAGINVSQWNTAPVLEENQCIENGTAGISFGLGAGGKAMRNVCRANKASGMLILDEGTAPELDANVCEENGKGAEERQPGWSVDRQDQVWDIDTGYMLKRGLYAELEDLAAKLRRHKSRTLAGDWQLARFYSVMEESSEVLNAFKKPEFAEAMAGWLAAYPESVTARIVQAKAYVRYAWLARGNDVASNVTPEGWQGFRENLGKAKDTLEEARALPEKDVELFVTYLRAGKGLNYENEPMDALVREGMAIEPGYVALYNERALSLLPKWGGADGELLAFIEKTGDDTKALLGDRMYALTIWAISTDVNGAAMRSGYFGEWERVDAGFKETVEDFPKSRKLKTAYLVLASLYGDMERAKELLDALGGELDPGCIQDPKIRMQYKKWIEGTGNDVVSGAVDRKELEQSATKKRMLIVLIACAGLAVFLIMLAIVVAVAIVAGNRAQAKNAGGPPPLNLK